MTHIPNQPPRSYASVVSGSPPTPTALLTPTSSFIDLLTDRQESSITETRTGCIWHHDLNIQCVCLLGTSAEATAINMGMVENADKEFKSDVTKDKEDVSVKEKESDKEDEEKDEGKNTVKDTAAADVKKAHRSPFDFTNGFLHQTRGVTLQGPKLSRWSKTPAELAQDTAARRLASSTMGMGLSTIWTRVPRVFSRKEDDVNEKRKQELIRESDRDFVQYSRDLDRVRYLNQSVDSPTDKFGRW